MELLFPPSHEPVELADYDPAWPVAFEHLRRLLAAALGEAAIRVEHVGSTSVPGLAAKPIVDVQVSVADVDDEDSYRPAIEALGWPLHLREPGHRYFRPPTPQPRTVQVHVCSAGSEWEWRHLLFRDYLRAHPERAGAYEELKRKLVASHGHDRLLYTDEKGPFIDETVALAERWAEQSGWWYGPKPV